MSVKRKRQSSTLSHKSASRKKRSAGGKQISEVLFNLVLPLMLIVIMLGAIGFLAYTGFHGATKTGFFEIKTVEVNGVRRIDKGEVEGVVRANAPNGTWAANLEQIRNVILQKFAYTKTVAVSRQLPDTVTVTIVERVPQAIVRREGGDSWVDDERVLGPVLPSDDRTGWLVMTGWDASDSAQSRRENKERVAAYTKLKDELSNFNVVSRVKEVDASNLSEIKAVIDQDGPVEINLGREDYSKRLEMAITYVSGSTAPYSYVDARVSPPVATGRTPGAAKTKRPDEQKPAADKKTDSEKSPKQQKTDDKKANSQKKKN